LNAVSGGTTSTANLESVVTNGNPGEFQFQLADAGAFGWRFCTTSGGSNCPVKIGGVGTGDQLLDIGSVLPNQMLLKYAGDAILGFSSSSGGHNSVGNIKSVTSGAHDGEMQWQISTATPYGWRFNATGGVGVIAEIRGTAPAASLVLNTDGTL